MPVMVNKWSYALSASDGPRQQHNTCFVTLMAEAASIIYALLRVPWLLRAFMIECQAEFWRSWGTALRIVLSRSTYGDMVPSAHFRSVSCGMCFWLVVSFVWPNRLAWQSVRRGILLASRLCAHPLYR